MDIEKLEKILQKYDIESEDDLALALDNLYNEESELEPGDRQYCLKNNFFQYHKDLPECRKVIEIYNKFYKDRYTKKNEFAAYWKNQCGKSPGLPTFIRYMMCKGCKCSFITAKQEDLDSEGYHQLKNSTITSHEAKLTLCNSLDVKLNDDLFKKKYPRVESFVKALEPITDETFLPKKMDNEINNSEKKMTQIERKKLFNTVYVTKQELKENLEKEETCNGSDIYLLNLALYAFERGLNEQTLKIVNKLQEKEAYQDDIDFLQLQAKLLSNIEEDDKAIRILEDVISLEEPLINPESYSLLAAALKRNAFRKYRNHELTDNEFIEEMKNTKELYSSVYAITKNYYPAINIIYIEKLLGERKDDILQKIWDESDIQSVLNEDEWWSQISDIEYSILMKKEEGFFEKISRLENKINSGELDVTDFNINSTVRQLKLMQEFTVDERYKPLIKKLEDFQVILEEKQINPNHVILE